MFLNYYILWTHARTSARAHARTHTHTHLRACWFFSSFSFLILHISCVQHNNSILVMYGVKLLFSHPVAIKALSRITEMHT